MRYFLQTRCTAMLITGILVAVQPACPEARESRPVRDQAAKLREAERFVDGVMSQVHKTLDFEPILRGTLLPEAVESFRSEQKMDQAVWSDDEAFRLSASLVTMLYLMPLVRASLDMDGVEPCDISQSFSESGSIPDCVPPDLKLATEGMRGLLSRHQEKTTTAAEVQELLVLMGKFRIAMTNHVRADVFTSAGYRSFVQEHRRDPEVSSWEGPSGKEPAYEVSREGQWFMIVERAGTLKIAAVAQNWLD